VSDGRKTQGKQNNRRITKNQEYRWRERRGRNDKKEGRARKKNSQSCEGGTTSHKKNQELSREKSRKKNAH
jgi:hypothetical protein